MPTRWSLEQATTLAVILEVSAPKPGNVHRGADFDDATFYDFATAAVAIAPPIARASELGMGRAVYDAIEATRNAVGTNTNLGTVLLITPLAMVPDSESIETGILDVLGALKPSDSQWVYRAIRLSEPGGLGEADCHDVAGDAPGDLLDAMRSAADRDLVARQYANGFQQVLGEVVPWIAADLENGHSLVDAIVATHVRLMSAHPDSLITRKCGPEVAAQSASLAADALAAGPVGSEEFGRSLASLDFWLRAEGRKRNPGTSADLIAAGLFVCLRDGIIQTPFVFSRPDC